MLNVEREPAARRWSVLCVRSPARCTRCSARLLYYDEDGCLACITCGWRDYARKESTAVINPMSSWNGDP